MIKSIVIILAVLICGCSNENTPVKQCNIENGEALRNDINKCLLYGTHLVSNSYCYVQVIKNQCVIDKQEDKI